MESTPVPVAFSPWQSFYATLKSSVFVGPVISTEPLLAGWWQYYPEVSTTLLVASSFQIVLASLGLILLGFLIYTRKRSADAVFDDSNTNQAVRTLLISKPFVTLTWQLMIGFIGVTLVKTWISSATATFIYLHSWFELTAFLLTVIVAKNVFLSLNTLAKLKISLLIIAGILTLIYMTAGDIYWRAAFGGIALVADLGNFFASMISYGILRNRSWWSEVNQVEGLSMALFISHVIIFYPEGLVAVFAPNGIYKAGVMMAAFTMINVPILAGYVGVLYRTVKQTGPANLPFYIRP
jgi:hypothetical protein